MKKFILGFLTAALLFSALPIGAAVQQYTLQATTTKLIVDSAEVKDEKLPILSYQGYNYIPAAVFRSICDKIGVGFKWDSAAKEIQLTTSTIAPTETTADSGGNAMSDVPLNKYGLPDFSNYNGVKPTIERDGRNSYFMYNGVKYIHVANYTSGVSDNLLPSNFRFEQTFVGGKLSGILRFTTINSDTNKITVLIEEVPYAYLDNFYYEYDYYLNTILRLIK